MREAREAAGARLLGRRLFGLWIAGGAAALGLSVLPGCEGEGPRALILADASGPGHAALIDARAAAFKEQRGRAVRVLRVASGEAAVELAARGEADVAVVPQATSIDRFLAAEQGSQAGELDAGGARFRVLTVNPKQLPKVDAQGAALAAFLAGAPEPRGASSRQ
jgi:hypothetical protein